MEFLIDKILLLIFATSIYFYKLFVYYLNISTKYTRAVQTVVPEPNLVP